jgi:hypothetical protein
MNVLEEGMFQDVDGDVRSQSKQDPKEQQQIISNRSIKSSRHEKST